jgi:UPF0271 protein
MLSIDVNCDLGEGMPNDASIMQFISSANIACGSHAGDEATIRSTIRIAMKHNVAIGAHPGFQDKANFGRMMIDLGTHEYYSLIMDQLILFKQVADEEGAQMHHVKAHGGLYNLAVKNQTVATELAKAVYDFDPALIFYGLSNSAMLATAEQIGLRTASEVFSDRTYEEDGTLTPRVSKNSVLTNTDDVCKQALLMTTEKRVMSTGGNSIPVKADTICIHGDSPYAYSFAKAVYKCLKENGIEIKSVKR